jgi:hypothetical protein
MVMTRNAQNKASPTNQARGYLNETHATNRPHTTLPYKCGSKSSPLAEIVAIRVRVRAMCAVSHRRPIFGKNKKRYYVFLKKLQHEAQVAADGGIGFCIEGGTCTVEQDKRVYNACSLRRFQYVHAYLSVYTKLNHCSAAGASRV